jgi:short-subunit dehydrogenase
MKLDGSHVLVTGATRGIGRQLAQELSARGARLTLAARKPAELEALASGLEASAVLADLSDREQVSTLIPRVEEAGGPIDVLVNNAGIFIGGALARLSAEQLRNGLMTNLFAPLELARQALPGMLERGRGKIVNMSSLAGEMALRNMIAYGASKSALSHSTRALQRELRGTAVGALLVLLGSVETEMTTVDSNRDPVTAATNARFSRLAPLPVSKVTPKIADAIERDRSVLVMPGYGWPMTPIRMLPTRAADALLRGLPRSL